MPPNLPTPTILGYLAAAATPTRVRTLTARFSCAAGLLYVLLALAILAATLSDAIRVTTPALSPPDLVKLLNVLIKEYWFFCGIALCCIAAGTTLLLASPLIKYARRNACNFSHLALLPLIPFFILLAAALAVLAIALNYVRDERLALFLFLPAAIPALLALLTKDLCANLKWIANNPITEKPPTPFLR